MIKTVQKVLDFEAKWKETDLDVSWKSVNGVDLTPARDYELSCLLNHKEVDKKYLDSLIKGTPYNLRLFHFENGLRYVRIFDENNIESFDVKTYDGIVHNHNLGIHVANTRLARVINNADLNEGFRLETITTNPIDRKITSYINKDFSIDEKKFNAHYKISPPNRHSDGVLRFVYTVNESKSKTIKFDVSIDQDKKSDIFSDIQIHFIYDLTPQLRDPTSEQISFCFNGNGKLFYVSTISTADIPNSELESAEVISAMRKGQDISTKYNATKKEASVLSDAIFGSDVCKLSCNIRKTLDKLVDSAVYEKDVDFKSLVVFN